MKMPPMIHTKSGIMGGIFPYNAEMTVAADSVPSNLPMILDCNFQLPHCALRQERFLPT